MWKRSYRLRGNECVYSLIAEDGSIMLMGKTENSLFFMKTNEQGKERWVKFYGCDDRGVTALGVIPEGRGYLFGGSFAGIMPRP